MMLPRQLFIQLTGFFLLIVCSAVNADWLVTPKEAAESQAQYKKFPGMSAKAFPVMGAPEISLIKPSLSGVVKTPVDIQMVFKPKDGAEIDLSSFRVLYGFLGIDITSRLLKHAVPTEDGVKVSHADLPQGSHHLVIQVADKRQRKGQADIEFKVE